ncbi:MAG: hypothetical protein E7813_11215 [Bradyrhizobium sp.]|uniref:hypothetical protein n=1 Tax=Bradyrhizobium sp. TaxID=376 RepID=UPI0011F61D02|nr:hypothetical protein [Bradyrhizobium sp.]THD68199.1 MAG: hypothetical protein E7813_11215 [Bradyrhizobium sp.]
MAARTSQVDAGLKYPPIAWELLGGTLFLLFAFSRSSFVSKFLNSDNLLIVDWTNHVFFDRYNWQEFQFPTAPSLFPDFLTSVPVQLITGSWRAAIFVGAAVWFCTLLYGCGTVLSGITNLSAREAVSAVWLVTLVLMIVEMAKSGGGRHILTLQPITHGGAFIVSILAAILVHNLRRAFSWLRIGVLCLVCCMIVLSDRIFVFYFVAPMLLVLLIRGPHDRQGLAPIGSIVLGTIVGWFLADLLPHQQPLPRIEFSNITTRVMLFASQVDASTFVGTITPAIVFCVRFQFCTCVTGNQSVSIGCLAPPRCWLQ